MEHNNGQSMPIILVTIYSVVLEKSCICRQVFHLKTENKKHYKSYEETIIIMGVLKSGMATMAFAISTI